MSSEVCPFCGKTYKRLKSHLPHCKAAASSKTPPTKHDVTVNQTTSSSQLATAASSEPTAKGGKSTQMLSVTASPQSKKSKKVSVVSPAPPQSSSPATSSSQSLSLSSASLPPTTKKKKQKLSKQIKTANIPSSNTISLISSPSLSLSPTISEPKKKSLRASIEAAKSKQVSRPSVRDDSWVDNKGEIEDLSVNKMLLKSVSGHQARITLQDVKATLGRANAARQSSRKSILSQIETTDNLSSKIRPGTSLTPVPKSQQASLTPLRHDVSPQSELTSPATPLLSGHVSSQVSQATSPPHTVSMNEGLKVGRHMTGLRTLSPSLPQFSSPHLFPLAPQTLPARVETLRAADGLTMEKSQLEVRKQNTADNGTKGALTQRSLGQVRLRELPEWLACKTPSHPRDVVEMVQRGWQWYYKRYIDVKKGGVGGVGMLLAGYCVLGYIWSYPHIKRDRWRKYH